MPVLTLNAGPSAAARLVIALCALSLLATGVIVVAGPVTATDLSTEISEGRRSQQYYERVMLRHDRIVEKAQRQLKKNRRAYRQAKRDVVRGNKALRLVRRIVTTRLERLAAVEGAYATPEDAPKPWKYKERLRNVRTALRVAETRKRNIAARVRARTRERRARVDRADRLKRQRDGAIRKREAAEGALAAHIVRMTRLAATRAELQSTVQLSASSGSFSWPATGRISQTYGCTGFYINPSRGSCRHFHDGLDIVAAHGSPVRAAAVGVVAYVGWNPWDERGRAFIVVVAHPDGYVTRYGHVMARKQVRAGEVVHTGQAIARMGNTGYSTGTHLHFELLRYGSDVNPFAYLPEGVVKIKVDRQSTRKGTAKARRQAQQKARAAAERARKQERRAARAARRASAAAAVLDECDEPVVDETEAPRPATWSSHGFVTVDTVPEEPPAPPATCEPDSQPDASEEAPASVRPTVAAADSSTAEPPLSPAPRLPFRGTSPVPE